MDQSSLKNWLDGYKHAWEQTDPDAVGKLFAPDATYQVAPFYDPMRGRDAIMDYWTQVPRRTQTNIEFGYDILALDGNMGIVHWWVSFDRISSGVHMNLDGIFVLLFGDDRLCTSLREWWHNSRVDI